MVPIFNEDTILLSFHSRLKSVLETLTLSYNIIYVNDGSTDSSLQLLKTLQNKDENICILNLSRNFGKEIAIQAGLDKAEGDAVIIIDADLQDPPELIPTFIAKWQEGFDMVYGKRKKRHGDSVIKRTTAFLFYRVLQCMSTISIPKDVGDFRLLSQRAVQALQKLREQHRYMKGLYAWIGYPQVAIEYERDQRLQGKSKWNYFKLFNLAIEGITSFSVAPLKFASLCGFCIAFFAFLYALVIIYKTLIFGEPVQGYPSLMVVILFLGGVQLISLGILGEYLGRMFMEVKNRPLYLISSYFPAKILDVGTHKRKLFI